MNPTSIVSMLRNLRVPALAIAAEIVRAAVVVPVAVEAAVDVVAVVAMVAAADVVATEAAGTADMVVVAEVATKELMKTFKGRDFVAAFSCSKNPILKLCEKEN